MKDKKVAQILEIMFGGRFVEYRKDCWIQNSPNTLRVIRCIDEQSNLYKMILYNMKEDNYENGLDITDDFNKIWNGKRKREMLDKNIEEKTENSPEVSKEITQDFIEQDLKTIEEELLEFAKSKGIDAIAARRVYPSVNGKPPTSVMLYTGESIRKHQNNTASQMNYIINLLTDALYNTTREFRAYCRNNAVILTSLSNIKAMIDKDVENKTINPSE